jgi:hypothetical protein
VTSSSDRFRDEEQPPLHSLSWKNSDVHTGTVWFVWWHIKRIPSSKLAAVVVSRIEHISKFFNTLKGWRKFCLPFFRVPRAIILRNFSKTHSSRRNCGIYPASLWWWYSPYLSWKNK